MAEAPIYFDTLPVWRSSVAPALYPVGDPDGLSWSGVDGAGRALAPPAIGERVKVGVNGLGFGEVVGYWAQEGWLGVMVKLENPPAFYIENRKDRGDPLDAPCHVFGAELRAVQS